MLLKYGLLVGAFVAMMYMVSGLVSKPAQVSYDETQEIEAKKINKRKPASITDKIKSIFKKEVKSQYRVAKKDESKFAEEVPSANEENVATGAKRANLSKKEFPIDSARRVRPPDRPPVKNPARVTQSPSSGGRSSISYSPKTLPLPPKNNDDDDDDDDDDRKIPKTDTEIACSHSPGSGAFSKPTLVTLSCSSTADIKYTLNEGSCVSPGSGALYSGGVVVAPEDGNFCLSYICEAANGTVSDVCEAHFTITSGLPHLQASHPKIQYQTTELEGTSFLTSNDFGRDDYTIGQVNLRADPGVDTCENIYNNYVLSTPAPAPFQILMGVLLNTILPNSQIEIPLAASDLDYGDNYLMSFVRDERDALTPKYACSTTKVVLNDFEYFEAIPSHSQMVAGVPEFSGGFTPYGFFEETTVFRGPAGVSSQEQSGQRLESGLFQVFY